VTGNVIFQSRSYWRALLSTSAIVIKMPKDGHKDIVVENVVTSCFDAEPRFLILNDFILRNRQLVTSKERSITKQSVVITGFLSLFFVKRLYRFLPPQDSGSGNLLVKNVVTGYASQSSQPPGWFSDIRTIISSIVTL
jgi:hypothetical protein